MLYLVHAIGDAVFHSLHVFLGLLHASNQLICGVDGVGKSVLQTGHLVRVVTVCG